MSVPNEYIEGSDVRLACTFSPAPASGVTLLLIQPHGAKQTITTANGLVDDGNGAFHYDLKVDEQGVWAIRWTAVTPIAPAESWLLVKPSQFSPV